jgi:hypothetical protein
LAGKHSEKEATLHKVRAQNVQEFGGLEDNQGSWKMLKDGDPIAVATMLNIDSKETMLIRGKFLNFYLAIMIYFLILIKLTYM